MAAILGSNWVCWWVGHALLPALNTEPLPTVPDGWTCAERLRVMESSHQP